MFSVRARLPFQPLGFMNTRWGRDGARCFVCIGRGLAAPRLAVPAMRMLAVRVAALRPRRLFALPPSATGGGRAQSPNEARVVCSNWERRPQAQIAENTNKKRDTPSGCPSFLVEMTGFEPAASSSRTRRATKLRYISIFISIWADLLAPISVKAYLL